MPDDAELLRQFAESGKTEAFDAFVRGRLDLVYSSALRRTGGNVHLARDVAQEVFCAAARQARTLARHPIPMAWLYTTTRNAASDTMRSESRRKINERIHSEEAAALAEPTPAWQQLAPLLDAALDRLGATDRSAILLRYFDGLAYPEIGQRLKLTDNGARLRVDRALEKLRRTLSRHGITSTAAGLAVALEGHAIAAAPAGLASALSVTAVASAGSAAAGASLAAWASGTLMTTTKLALGISALALGSGVYFVAESRAERASLAAAQARIDGLESELTGISGRLADSQRARIALEASRRSAIGSAARDSAANQAAQQKLDRALASNALYLKLQSDRFRAQLRHQFQGLYEGLKLSPDQIQRFNEIQVDAYSKQTKLLLDLGADGRKTDAPDFVQAIAGIAGQSDAQVRALLGTAGFSEYQDYGRTGGARNLTDSLAQRVFFTDSPLTPAQAQQLNAIVLADRTGPDLDVNALHWSRVLEQAAKTLTPVQMESLRSVQAELQAGAEMRAVRAAVATPEP